MTIKELANYTEVETARPRTDMVLVKDLKKWAIAKVKELNRKQIAWIMYNFNLKESDLK